MKAVKLLAIALCGVLPLVSQAEEDAVKFELGVGLVISPDYNDALKDAYSDASVSGGGGWLGFHAGLKLNLGAGFALRPGMDLWLNAVQDPYGDTYANTVLIPNISARYDFTQLPSVFIEAGVNYGVPNTGDDQLEFESAGIGFSGGVGFTFNNDIDVTLSYWHVPSDSPIGEVNLGGVRIGANFRM